MRDFQTNKRQGNGVKHCSDSYRNINGKAFQQWSDFPDDALIAESKAQYPECEFKLVTIYSKREKPFKRLYKEVK